MRTVVGALLVSGACISTAFAQQISWAMDHGHTADAAAEARAAAASARIKTFAIVAKIPRRSNQQTDFSFNRRGVAPLSPEEQTAEAEARAAWQVRCRPTVVEDREGVRRTQYADSNCDLSRFDTAGTP